MLAGQMLDLAARRSPNRAAIRGGGRPMTFAELSAESNRFANALHADGIGKGDRIAMMLPNIPEYPVIHFGAARSGAILAHLSFRYAPKDLIFVLNKIGATLFVFHADYSDLVAQCLPESPQLRRLVVVGRPGLDGIDTQPFEAFLSGHSTEPPTVEILDTDPYSITFTGGTTGFPKAVVVSHKGRAVSAMTVAAQHGLDDTDRGAIVTPLFHAAGLFVWFQPLIWMGCTCSLLPTWDPEAFMTLVERDEVTAVFLVPTQLNGLVRDPGFDPARLKSLRNVGYAGSPMPPALITELRELFPEVAFTENYGQSETGPMTLKRHWEYPDKSESIGRPVINVELDVFDPDGSPLPPGEPGEIVTRGDHLLVEYYDEPEQTQALFKSGDDWLWTGDLGFRDEDGYFTLVDRSKDMIISGGENIYPKEIEEVLYRHEAVSECAVFGIPDDHWGEVPAAHVVLRAEATVTSDELVAFSVEYLARYKRPRLIEFVQAIPKTPVGKIQKHLLRAPYWKDRDRKI